MVFILAFLIMLLLIAGMAVGVMVQNKPLKGSCGGLNKIGMKKDCAICGGDDVECEKEQQRQKAAQGNSDLAYDASKR